MFLSRSDTYLLLAAAAGVGYWFYSKARALGNLVFSPGTVLGMQFINGMPVITLSIIVQNTSGASLFLQSFAGNVYSNDTLIGNVYNFVPVSIPGNSQISMPVQVQLQPLGVANDIINAFSTGNFTQQIDIRGGANVNGFQLPVIINFAVGKK